MRAEDGHATGSAASVDPGRVARLRGHLQDPLYRTGYFLMVATALTAGLGLAFWGLAAHRYPTRVVGLNSAAISAIAFLSGVCTLGLEAVLVRYLPTAGSSARRLVIRCYLLTTFVALIVGLAAAATSSIWSPRLHFLGDQAGWLVGFPLATAAWALFALQDTVLIALRATSWLALEDGLYAVVKLVLAAVLIGVLPFSGLFVAWTAPAAVGIAGVSLLIFGRLLPLKMAERHSVPLDGRRLVNVAAGNFGATVFWMGTTSLLPILVANRTSATETAYFYMPWTVATVLQFVGTNLTAPLTVEAALDESRLRELTRRTLVHMMRVVIPVAVVCGVAAPWLLTVFGSRYSHAGTTLLRLLVAGAIPNMVLSLGIGVARVMHRSRTVLAIQAAQCISLLGLTVLLLPGFGLDGAGMAWIVSQLVVALCLLGGMLRPLLFTPRTRGGESLAWRLASPANPTATSSDSVAGAEMSSDSHSSASASSARPADEAPMTADELGRLAAGHAQALRELLAAYERAVAATPARAVEVGAGPFSSIAELHEFERALARLPRVRQVTLRSFEGSDRVVFEVQLEERSPSPGPTGPASDDG